MQLNVFVQFRFEVKVVPNLGRQEAGVALTVQMVKIFSSELGKNREFTNFTYLRYWFSPSIPVKPRYLVLNSNNWVEAISE